MAKILRQAQGEIEIGTGGQGLYEFTRRAREFVTDQGFGTGQLTLFCRHTSCSLLIQENADPDVETDLMTFFGKLVPEGADWMVHTLEGPDDMPAHIKSALTLTNLTIPIVDGDLALGTWQGIYLFEHRARPHRRQIVLHGIGD